jgi:hypothetical protein
MGLRAVSPGESAKLRNSHLIFSVPTALKILTRTAQISAHRKSRLFCAGSVGIYGTMVTPCPVAPPRLLLKLTAEMDAMVVWKE